MRCESDSVYDLLPGGFWVCALGLSLARSATFLAPLAEGQRAIVMAW